MIGKRSFSADNPRFLLDESLAPVVAQALALVGYEIADIETVFGQKGVKDPEIIEWCQENEAVWIHADDRARKQHGALLQTSGIRTVWVYRRRGAMTGKEQLRILSSALPRLIDSWQNSPSDRHHQVSAANELSRPSVRAITV